MNISCVVAEDANRVAYRTHELRDPTADELLVKTAFSGISPGTELRCIAGRELNAPTFPMITGYSLVGTVLKGAGAVKEGDQVFLNGASVVPDGIASSWGGHMSHAIATPDQAVVLPQGIDPAQASLLSMASIAMHGVCKSRLTPGDRVLVVGQGLIGQIAAALCCLNGCVTAVCDPVAARLEISREMGVQKTYLVNDSWPKPARDDFPDGFDAVIDVTGSPDAVAANQFLLRDKSWENPYESSPRLVLLASYPGDIHLNYQEILFGKEAEIVTCRTYLPHEREAVLRLMAAGALDLAPLITHRMPAARADEAFARLRDDPTGNITIVLDWKLDSHSPQENT